MNYFIHKPIVDQSEAPAGFYAIAKPEVNDFVTNPCALCDFRPECCDPNTDLALHNHRCMADPVVIIKTGVELCRHDKCSVIFKLINEVI